MRPARIIVENYQGCIYDIYKVDNQSLYNHIRKKKEEAEDNPELDIYIFEEDFVFRRVVLRFDYHDIPKFYLIVCESEIESVVDAVHIYKEIVGHEFTYNLDLFFCILANHTRVDYEKIDYESMENELTPDEVYRL